MSMLIDDKTTFGGPDNWRDAAHLILLDMDPDISVTQFSDEYCSDEIDDAIEHCRKNWQDNPKGTTVDLVWIGFWAAYILKSRGIWDVNETLDLLCRKQHDYGHDNINAFGLLGLVVRTSDKVARWKHMSIHSRDGQAEPLIDALVDMVGYAVIAQMLENDTFRLELS